VRASPLDATTIASPYSTFSGPGLAAPAWKAVNKKKNTAAVSSGIFLYICIWFFINSL
jgi:hypothetical protein